MPRASAAQLAAPLIQSVLALLPSLSSEVAQTVLDTLIVALELSPAATSQLEPAVTSSLLQLWQKHIADVMLTAAIVDSFVTIACIQEAVISLAVRQRSRQFSDRCWTHRPVIESLASYSGAQFVTPRGHSGRDGGLPSDHRCAR